MFQVPISLNSYQITGCKLQDILRCILVDWRTETIRKFTLAIKR